MMNIVISIYGDKGTKPVKLTDNMPIWDQSIEEEPKKQSVEEMKELLLGMAREQNRKVKDSKKTKKS